MPFETALPAPNAAYDRIVTWPQGDSHKLADGTAFITSGTATQNDNMAYGQGGFVNSGPNSGQSGFNPLGGTATTADLFGSFTGGAPPTATGMRVHRGIYHYLWDLPAASQREITIGGPGFTWYAVPRASAFAAGAEGLPSLYRVYWLTVFLSWGTLAANPTNNSGFILQQLARQPSGVSTWPNGANPAQSVGLFGDGAGGAEFRSIDNLGATIQGPIAVPGWDAAGGWNTLEFVGINSAVGREASIQTWVNGTLIATSSWAAGNMDDYDPAFFDGPQRLLAPTWRVADNFQSRMGPLVCRNGRFTRAGLELST